MVVTPMDVCRSPRVGLPEPLIPCPGPRASGPGRLVLLLLCLAALGGCRRATEADCEKIVDRIVELQLREQGVTDSETIAKRKEETKAKKRQELLGGCVGKRISNSSLKCIEGAKTSSEIIDICLR